MLASLVSTGRRRAFDGWGHRVFIILAALFAAGVIYGNLFIILDRLIVGVLFVCGVFTLLFLAIGAGPRAPDRPTVIDWVLSGLSLACGVFFFLEAPVISNRITLLDPLTPAQFFF
ncbi:MAG: hypothetical protein ACK4OP_04090, partial [Gemmobacter sp.]